ncbi:MAG: mannose-1-phosphate guanylyltransferase [Treponema sp.]|jgi:mannose-1-phosphate guanylyltransferase/mannose-1-phosphate guanylyltransferase/mannose-6-phosphate isomerase|nr:mannose-1-phosphate guanylyltransferase [Treponema sp.]
MFDDALIMAGGSGTRLWPASSRRFPKQFLPAPQDETGSVSFFRAALERALQVISPQDGRVIVIAGQAHAPLVCAQAAGLNREDQRRVVLIPEPAAKNTAPAIACGAVFSGPGRTMLVLPSDHLISPLETFKADAAAAAVFARQGALVVFGIPPRAPETGYGYIEAAEALGFPPGQAPSAPGPQGKISLVYRAASFREKPVRSVAEAFAASGRFYWNSGMFAFNTSFIEEEFRRNAPDVFAPFAALKPPQADASASGGGLRVLSSWDGLAQAYMAAPAISFDYAIAEKCAATVMVAAGFDWYDVGSWDEYARLSQARGASGAEVYGAGAENCFVDADLPVALCGVEDLIVVIRSGKDGGPPVALISRRGQSQRVREIVEQIEAAGGVHLL